MTSSPGTGPVAPFGRVVTAMVTPLRPDGSLDTDGAQRLARHLLAHGSDGLVVAGTTGEAPTLSHQEKEHLLRAVVEAVDGAPVLAGVGTYDTAASVELARTAEKAGATGLLVVTPYYSKPPQAGLLAHFTTVADATDLPVMLYDIPGRTAVPIATETLLRCAGHPRIVAVKDAKGDLAASGTVMAATDLAWYSGDDVSTLPLLALGAVGVVSVVSHLAGEQIAGLVAAWAAGDPAGALAAHRRLLPAFTGFFRTQGVILTKTALGLAGLPAGPLRPPLVPATAAETDQLRADCAAAGISLDGGGA